MADHTKIEWTDATWNPITGCQIVSPGCTNCYAMKLAGGRLQHHPSRAGLTQESKSGPVWTGEVRFNREWLTQPLQWTKPRMIFVCAHGDLFADGVEDEWLDQIFAVMALAPNHVFQVLTKRPEKMRAYITDERAYGRILEAAAALRADRPYLGDIPISDPRHAGFWTQLWLGVSVEDQPRAEQRIPILLDTPASIRWISAEPMLGEVDWKRWLPAGRRAIRPNGEPFIAPHFYMIRCERCGWTGSSEFCGTDSWGDDSDVYCPNCHTSGADSCMLPHLDWVVAGGESGHGARPMHPDWVRSLRDQCAAADIPFLFKQWGNWQIASEGNGHLDHQMERNDAYWVDIDGKRHKPSSIGLMKPYAMHRVTKAIAGRLLDGVEHNAFPPLPQHFKDSSNA